MKNMNKRKKLYLSIIVMIMLLLVSCGSRKTPIDEVNNTVDNKSLIDVFFHQQSDSEKQYLNNMLKKYESKINVSEFEFTLEEAITESNTGYCFYKVNIKSNTIPVGKMTIFNDLYQLTDGTYWIQVATGASPDVCPDYCASDVSQRINVISDNEVEAFLCCKNQFESNDIDIQVLKEDENGKQNDKGKLKLEETRNSVRFDVSEDLYCWVGSFGMMKIYPYKGVSEQRPFGQAKEVALLMKDESKIVVYSIDENINTGYGMQTDGITAKSAYDFEQIVDVSNIKSLQIDDNIYEISDVNLD